MLLRLATILSFTCAFWLTFSPVHAQCNETFLDTLEVTLDQSEQLLGQPQSATRLSNDRLVVTTADPGVFLFESDGSFVRQLGAAGQGPFEYQNPSIVRAFNDNIAIWDAGNMKVTVYSQEGDTVSEWTGFTWGVADFAIHDGVLYSYYGSVDAPYLRIWDLEAEEMIAEYDDEESVERAALAQMHGTGSLALHDGSIYALNPAESSVQQFDVADGDVVRYPINDTAFTMEPLEASSISELNSMFAEVMEFSLSSSRSYKVVATPSALLTVMQHGTITYDAPLFRNNGMPNPDARMESYNRYLHVHQLTYEGEATRCQRIDIDIEQVQNDHVILGPTPHGFIYRTIQETNDDVEYVLTEYALPQ